MTALQLAVAGGGMESTELMIAAGGDVFQRTPKENWTLATLAHNNGFERVANRLLQLEEARRSAG
jgi:L-asparaginase II